MEKKEQQTPAFRRRRKAFMLMPIVVIPFLLLFFISLGGGRGQAKEEKTTAAGYNKTLPEARFDKKKPEKDKLGYYRQADQDSLRRKEYLRHDPYYQQAPFLIQTQTKTDELTESLEKLKKTLHEPVAAAPEKKPIQRHNLPPDEPDSTTPDPELAKLDGMLDKILKIQHPTQDVPNSLPPDTPDTVASNSIPAVVSEDQVLVSGATVALRLTEEVRINNITFPRDQLAYGVVSISNDRMLVTVNSLRKEQSIYTTALQVYDMDGLPGIHIPGDLGRETAKQSAEQSINSLGYLGLDASPMSQVTNAGVQAARTLLSRKVRLVRVGVRAGYRVLLRSTKAPVKVQRTATPLIPDSIMLLPSPEDFPSFMHTRVRHDKAALTLESIYLRDSLLWFSLRLENQSPIVYRPDYMHWSIRDKHRQRRTAIQELALEPIYSSPAETLAGDSSRMIMVAFRPFALPNDKELVLQLAEGNGARELVMNIGSRQLLKAKKYEKTHIHLSE